MSDERLEELRAFQKHECPQQPWQLEECIAEIDSLKAKSESDDSYIAMSKEIEGALNAELSEARNTIKHLYWVCNERMNKIYEVNAELERLRKRVAYLESAEYIEEVMKMDFTQPGNPMHEYMGRPAPHMEALLAKLHKGSTDA